MLVGCVVEDLAVDGLLNDGELLGDKSRDVREAEAGPVGLDKGALLASVLL